MSLELGKLTCLLLVVCNTKALSNPVRSAHAKPESQQHVYDITGDNYNHVRRPDFSDFGFSLQLSAISFQEATFEGDPKFRFWMGERHEHAGSISHVTFYQRPEDAFPSVLVMKTEEMPPIYEEVLQLRENGAFTNTIVANREHGGALAYRLPKCHDVNIGSSLIQHVFSKLFKNPTSNPIFDFGSDPFGKTAAPSNLFYQPKEFIDERESWSLHIDDGDISNTGKSMRKGILDLTLVSFVVSDTYDASMGRGFIINNVKPYRSSDKPGVLLVDPDPTTFVVFIADLVEHGTANWRDTRSDIENEEDAPWRISLTVRTQSKVGDSHKDVVQCWNSMIGHLEE